MEFEPRQFLMDITASFCQPIARLAAGNPGSNLDQAEIN
jgi:hypothetical protein